MIPQIHGIAARTEKFLGPCRPPLRHRFSTFLPNGPTLTPASNQAPLVDFDHVCVTNTSRQLQALSTNVAKRRSDVLAERLALSGKNEHHSCEERSLVRGTASFVTGTFGLVAASVVVNAIASGEVPIP